MKKILAVTSFHFSFKVHILLTRWWRPSLRRVGVALGGGFCPFSFVCFVHGYGWGVNCHVVTTVTATDRGHPGWGLLLVYRTAKGGRACLACRLWLFCSFGYVGWCTLGGDGCHCGWCVALGGFLALAGPVHHVVTTVTATDGWCLCVSFVVLVGFLDGRDDTHWWWLPSLRAVVVILGWFFGLCLLPFLFFCLFGLLPFFGVGWFFFWLSGMAGALPFAYYCSRYFDSFLPLPIWSYFCPRLVYFGVFTVFLGLFCLACIFAILTILTTGRFGSFFVSLDLVVFFAHASTELIFLPFSPFYVLFLHYFCVYWVSASSHLVFPYNVECWCDCRNSYWVNDFVWL